MNRASLLIALLMGALTVLLWGMVNRPDIEPPWPAKIEGFSFSPMRGEQNPDGDEYPDIAQIDEDLALLAGDAHAVRTYTVQSTLAQVPRLAGAHGLNVTLGAWITDQADFNDAELAKLIEVYRENHEQVVRVIVGNEAILREDQTVEQMIGAPANGSGSRSGRRSVRPNPGISGSNTRNWSSMSISSRCTCCPTGKVSRSTMRSVTCSIGTSALQEAYPDKQIVISEVGWPSNGRTRKERGRQPAPTRRSSCVVSLPSPSARSSPTT